MRAHLAAALLALSILVQPAATAAAPPITFVGYLPTSWGNVASVDVLIDGAPSAHARIEKHGEDWIYRAALPPDVTDGRVSFLINGNQTAREWVYGSPGASFVLNLTRDRNATLPAPNATVQPVQNETTPPTMTVIGTVGDDVPTGAIVRFVYQGNVVAEAQIAPNRSYEAHVPTWVPFVTVQADGLPKPMTIPATPGTVQLDLGHANATASQSTSQPTHGPVRIGPIVWALGGIGLVIVVILVTMRWKK